MNNQFNNRHIKTLDSSYHKKNQAITGYAFPDFTEANLEPAGVEYANVEIFGELDVEDNITTSLMIYPFDVKLKNQVYKTTGIGGVTTYPEYRGQGGTRRLFEALLKKEYEENVVLSLLGPFSYRFYSKFNYEQIYDELHIKIPTEKFPVGSKTSLCMKRLDYLGILPIMKQVYQKAPEFKRFGMDRQDWNWDLKFKFLKKSFFAYCADENGEALGYVAYQMTAGEFKINELVALTYEALENIVHFLQGHGMSYKHFTYISPISDAEAVPLLQLVKEEYDVERKLYPRMMMRIVNVSKFLESYPYEADVDDVTFEIIDDGAPWNHGIFTNRGVAIEKAARQHLKMDVKTMAAIFSGFGNLEQKVFSNAVESDSVETVKRLQRALVKDKPVLADAF